MRSVVPTSANVMRQIIQICPKRRSGQCCLQQTACWFRATRSLNRSVTSAVGASRTRRTPRGTTAQWVRPDKRARSRFAYDLKRTLAPIDYYASGAAPEGDQAMAYVDWLIRTKKIATCSCDYGCPCEFNAPPTRLPCEGVVAMEIAEGYFGDVPLDGLRAAGVYRYPGPIHEGHGTWWSIVDRMASPQQVDALSKILGGKEQDPTTGFSIYGSTVENEPEPIVADN